MNGEDPDPADYQRWLEDETYWDALDERLEDLPPSRRGVPVAHDPVFLTPGERNKIAASLALTAAVQVALGDNAGALESTLLVAKVRDGLDDDEEEPN